MHGGTPAPPPVTTRETPSGERWGRATLQSPPLCPLVLGSGGFLKAPPWTAYGPLLPPLPRPPGPCRPAWGSSSRGSRTKCPLAGRDPLHTIPNLAWMSVTAADPRPGQRRGGHARPRDPAFSEAARKQQHLEQIPWTETCPRSNITTGNPNGSSLATHQTDVCEETRSGWPQSWKGSQCPVCL